MHQNSAEKTESVRDTLGLCLIFIPYAIQSDSHTEALIAYCKSPSIAVSTEDGRECHSIVQETRIPLDTTEPHPAV